MRLRHPRGRPRTRCAAAALAALLLAAACAGDDPQDGDEAGAGAPTTAAADPQPAATTTQAPVEEPATTTAAPTTTAPAAVARPQSPPYRAELSWGTFVLAERIAAKLDLDETLTLVLSVGGGEGPGAALAAAWPGAVEAAAERHRAGLEARVVGAGRADGAARAEEVDSLVLAGEVDCLAVEAPEGDGPLARVVDRAANSGVPVFTVGGDSAGSKRFAFYGLDDLAAGTVTGELVGRWAVERRILLRRAGVLAGDANDEGSQRRMEGFIAGIESQIPDIEFVNRPGDGVVSQGSDPGGVYERSGKWILEHPDVDIVFHADSGLEMVSKFIADESLYGDVSAAGFGMSQAVGNYIREGVVVAAMLPGGANQAAAAADACADLLLAGAYDTGAVAVDPVAVTDDNVLDRDWTLPENR